ncbi:MAG TPA: hypothetical protein VKB19_09425 [Pedobacter sp.]|nr:hypothetical protein [Pedobacter sp.]
MIWCGLCAACKRLPDVQGKGADFLQGIWNQDSVADAGKLLNYARHKFKFTCDSFYVDLTTHSKVNYYSDSCFNNGIWKEYAKGTYKVRADTVFLAGTYTKANYKQKISGCYQIGQYIKSFRIVFAESETLVLESTENQRLLELDLKQKIKCVPQPL